MFGPQSLIPSAKVLSASTSIAPPVLGLLRGDPGPQLSPYSKITHPTHMPTAHPNGAQPRTFLGLVSIGMDSPQAGVKRPNFCSAKGLYPSPKHSPFQYSEDNVPARFPQVGISTPSFLVVILSCSERPLAAIAFFDSGYHFKT